MKKEYQKPSTVTVKLDAAALMQGVSGSEVTSEKDIDYDGLDEEGTKEPAARMQNVWEDKEEEAEL